MKNTGSPQFMIVMEPTILVICHHDPKARFYNLFCQSLSEGKGHKVNAMVIKQINV